MALLLLFLMIMRTNFLMLLLTGLIAGCSSGKSGNINTTNRNSNTNGGLVAECNGIPANGKSLTGAISSFFDQSTQRFRDDLAQIILTTSPIEITATPNQSMQILRWEINTSNGQKKTSSVVPFWVRLKANGNYINGSTALTSISQSTVATMINNNGLSQNGIDVNNFLSQVVLIATGLTSSDDALSFAFYDTQAGAQASVVIDALLPPFSANPLTYQTNHPQPLLYMLHPNINMGAGLSDQDYVNATNNFCTLFF